jgi:type IV secretion system protein VirD4
MQGTNVLLGQIVVVFAVVIAGVWGATQWTAAALGYQLRLGSPWFDFLGTPVYHPWKLFEWWFFFDAYASHVFDIGGAIAGGSGLVAVVVAIAMSVWRSRQSKLVTTYGSARWADAVEIREAGLTDPAGVFLGLHDGQYLRHEGPEHVLTFAPTRSGKGRGPGRSHVAILACVRRHPRHQRRKLGHHCRLAFTLFTLPAVQPHRFPLRCLQPFAGGTARHP